MFSLFLIVIGMGYEKGDNVIVYTSRRKHDKILTEFSVCSVIAVGKHDLVCRFDSRIYDNIFCVSKKRCVKIPDKSIPPENCEVQKPKIGDLITSITVGYDKKVTEVTGIVEEIIFNPLKHSQTFYIIRTGRKTETVYSENVIILES